VAHFDRVIPPGGVGKIALKINTQGYQGKIIKSARVYTNDPASRVHILRISAFIKVPIYLSTRYVYFLGIEGQSQTRVVEVISKLHKPLSLSPLEFTLAERIKYEILELEKGKHFRLRFTLNPGEPGSYFGFLKLKTNYQEKPQILIKIRAKVLKKRTQIPTSPAQPKH